MAGKRHKQHLQANKAKGHKMKMRTAGDVVNRIRHDPMITPETFSVEYLDRFEGTKEKAFLDFNWEDDLGSISHKETAIPQHRIETFKLYHKAGEEVVWDKESRVDKIYGSTSVYGSSLETLTDVIERLGADNLVNARQRLQLRSKEQEKKKEDAWMAQRLKEQGAAEGYVAGEFNPVIPTPLKTSITVPSAALIGHDGDQTHHSGGRVSLRPNYFIGLRITPLKEDQTKNSFLGKIASVVENACRLQPLLAQGVVHSSKFHITLISLMLRNEVELYRACEIMLALEESSEFQKLYSILTRGIPYHKVTLLSERVLVAVPGEGEGDDDLVRATLRAISDLLRSTFMSKGMAALLVGNRKDFNPHTTILKINRTMNKDVKVASPSHEYTQIGVNHVNSDCFHHLNGVPLGSMACGGVHLCAMRKPLRNAFFHTDMSLPTSALNKQRVSTTYAQHPCAATSYSHGHGFKFDWEASKWVEQTDRAAINASLATFSKGTPDTSRLKFFSLNVLFDRFDKHLVKTKARIPKLLNIIAIQNADIICLQEVEAPFLCALLSETWVKEGYWSSAVPESKTISPFGQVILSKYPLRRTTCLHTSNSIKRQIIADLCLTPDVRLMVASIHLSSDLSQGKRVNRQEKRKEEINSVLRYFKHTPFENDVYHAIVGDFNIDENKQLGIDGFVDLWETLCPEGNGLTYDCERNQLAKILSMRGQSFRPDRILIGKTFRKNRTILELNSVQVIETHDEGNLPASDHNGIIGCITISRAIISCALEHSHPVECLHVYELDDVVSWEKTTPNYGVIAEEGTGCFIPGDAYWPFKSHHFCSSSHILLLVKKKRKDILEVLLAFLGVNPRNDGIDVHFYNAKEMKEQYRDLIVSCYSEALRPHRIRVWGHSLYGKNTVEMNPKFSVAEVSSFESYYLAFGGDILRAYLEYTGRFAGAAHKEKIQNAISVVSSCWKQVMTTLCNVRVQSTSDTKDTKAFIVPFGSFCYGRKSDVDLCLIGIKDKGGLSSHQEKKWMLELARLLTDEGFFVHIGTSAKCPRLRAQYRSEVSAPVDFDLVFSTMSIKDVDKYLLREDGICHDISNVGSMLRRFFIDKRGAKENVNTSLEGVERTLSILDVLESLEERERSIVLPAIEFCSHVFTLAGLYGSRANGLRTFHLTQLLKDFIIDGGAPASSTSIGFVYEFLKFITCTERLSSQYLTKLLKSTVDDSLLQPIAFCFMHCKEIARAIAETEKRFTIANEAGLDLRSAKVEFCRAFSAPFCQMVGVDFSLSAPLYLAVLPAIKDGHFHCDDLSGRQEDMWRAQIEINAWLKLFLTRVLNFSQRDEHGVELASSLSSNIFEAVQALRKNAAGNDLLVLGNEPFVLRVKSGSAQVRNFVFECLEDLKSSFSKHTAVEGVRVLAIAQT